MTPLASEEVSGPSLTAGADVVVLTGLPGDVESETAYQLQLERLLEVLALEQARPRRVFVLNDSGDAGAVPPPLEVTVLSGNRQGFVALADELAGSSAPLAVFVWGHGGLMGRDPVFHVRGPRLAPADFRALAESAGGPSRWVLLFRHSGAFARALRGPGRGVLSSEHETAFKSDPVAVDLLLEILRAAPDLSLTGLGERLGPATLAWYEEQHLARQEEPTLWRGDEPPRRLASEEARVAVVGGGSAAGSAVSANDAGVGDGIAEQPSEPAALSPAWDGLEPVSAADYPGAAAVVLRRTLTYVLADDPALQQETDEVVQILTPEGSVHGDFDIAYHPPGEKITFLDCEVRRPDGTVVRLAPDQIRDATPAALPEYRPATRKIFSLPQAVPGAILRLHYRREWRRFPLPHVPLEIPIVADLPLAASRIEVRVPRGEPLHYAFRRHAAAEPEVRETPYATSFIWSFRGLEPAADEVLAAPQRTPTLLVSTFPSWQEFSAWYRRLIRQADELTDEIAAKAAELSAGAASDREKVAALYDFVTGLRYVAVPFGVNSHRPHAAANVFANRYGDCKDKANLFNTMLRAVGIEADLVLVPRFSQAYEATPGLGFNHAISRVRLDAEVIWADTTDDLARFGLLPPGDAGRNVLVIHDDVTGLTALPTPEPADHRLTLTAQIDLVPPFSKGGRPAEVSGGISPGGSGGISASATLDVATAGFPDYALRTLARAAAGHAGTQPVPLARLDPVNGYFAMAKQRHTPVAALDRDFAWHGEGHWTGLAVAVGDDVLVRAPFLLPADWRLALHERTTPLYLNRGYPLTLSQEVEFVLPAGAGRPRVPEAMASQGGPLRWRVTWEANDAHRLTARLEVVLVAGELDWEGTLIFRQELHRLYEALGHGALVDNPRSSNSIP